MLPPCFAFADRVFPHVRHRAARLMADEGLTQSEIGRRLDVSQAMVSKYLHTEPTEVARDDAWVVEEMAQQAAAGLEASVSGTPEAGQANPWCRTFAQTAGPGGDARRAVVAETAGILSRLDGEPVGGLVPAVNVNIAGATPDAEERDHVAAFPGRLALVGGRLRAHGPPEFGASQHLSAVLLAARATRSELRFVANVRADHAVRRALQRLGERVADADGAARDAHGVPAFSLDDTHTAVLDPGGFGIEPAVYLFAPRADVLAQRLVALARALA